MAKHTNPAADAAQILIERADILATENLRGYVVEMGDHCLHLLSFDCATGMGWALSFRTGMVYLVLQTGDKRYNSGVVRVSVHAANDSGRADGKLDFPHRTSGGYIAGTLCS